MYKDYFGFIEAPFSIVPNAKYLFLSTRHREALAHLQAGLGDGGGFAMLTGEVGTGKTTVSKAMLASIGSEIEARLILNPTFSETELLESICDEFSVGYPDNASLKQLNQAIFGYLHKNHDLGKQTLLLIDEAQHLSANVLEQLRLLTNLETDSEKLLKVLLIGQPELQANLQTAQLRQLAQRITGRYHLLPLTEQEIEQYIRFRVKTAGVEKSLFPKKVVRLIARKTGGVPRLINLVCDKALQYTCYNAEEVVTFSVAEKACEDVMSFQAPSYERSITRKKTNSPAPLYASLTAIALIVAGYKFAPDIKKYVEAQLAPVPALEEPIVRSEPEVQPNILSQFIQGSHSEVKAIQTLYRLWGVEATLRESRCDSGSLLPYLCEQKTGFLEDIKESGRPVVLNLRDNGQNYEVVLYALYQDKAELINSSERIQVPVSWLNSVWNGRYFTLWHNEIDKVLRFGSSGQSVLILDKLLATALNEPALNTDLFGEEMYQRVRVFQRWQGLEADGIVGEQTLRLLDLIANNSAPELKVFPYNKDAELSQKDSREPEIVQLKYPDIQEGQPLALIRAKYIRLQLETAPEKTTEKVVQPESDVRSPERIQNASNREVSENTELTLDKLDLSELSPELAQLVKGAIDETESTSEKRAKADEIPSITDIKPDKLAENRAKYEGQLPPLNLQTHMYATDSKRRWVKINGKELNEGDWLDSDIKLISITPRNIVIEFEHQPIEIPALYEWNG